MLFKKYKESDEAEMLSAIKNAGYDIIRTEPDL